MDGQQLIRAARRVAIAVLAALSLAGPAAALSAHHAGWQPLVERSASMAPSIATGDLVLVQRGRADRMRRGDVVTFADPRVAGRTLTHRVVSVTAEAGHLRVVTRGDANRAAEAWAIDRAGTVGRLRMTVPLPGVVTTLLDRSRRRGVVMAVLSLLACGLTLRAIWRRPAAVPCVPAR